MLAIIVLLAGVSVQAQKGKGIQPIGPPVKNQLSVQDQTGGGYITFDILTGEFTCNMCEYKYIFKGIGQVKVDGFNVYLSAVTDQYQMFITLDMWERNGKAVMEVYQSPETKAEVGVFQEFWTDLNIDNNTLSCYAIQPRQ